MTHLEHVSVEALEAALDAVEDKRPTKRLMVSIAYKHGVTQSDLATWYGIERKTVYNWLARFDDSPEDLAGAARDASRPGRPGKLTADEHDRLLTTLRDPPTRSGYDADSWTPELVRRHVDEAFDEDYSLSSCRRFLRACSD